MLKIKNEDVSDHAFFGLPASALVTIVCFRNHTLSWRSSSLEAPSYVAIGVVSGEKFVCLGPVEMWADANTGPRPTDR